MGRQDRLMEMRRELGCARYYAWRVSCKVSAWQKRHGSVAAEHVCDAIGSFVWWFAGFLSWFRKAAIKGLLLAVVALMACIGSAACRAKESSHSTYPKVLQVVGVQGAVGGWCLDMMDCNGFTWHVDIEDGGYTVGDTYSCIMDDMGTRQIADDTIVSMRYERVDLMIKGDR